MIHIMLVEDHPALSEGLELFINQQTNFEVVANKKSGIEAMAFLIEEQPDVLVTDISMPDMDGYELTRKIKNLFPHIKVIALSMFDNEQAIQEMMQSGVDGYVVKSSPLKILKEAIISVHDGNSYYDPSILVPQRTLNSRNKQRIPLSRSEREILILIAQGHSSATIADLRGTAVSTVNKHRKNIMYKLRIEGKGELYKYALQRYGFNS